VAEMSDYYTPAPQPANYYGYQPGSTYMINGYRMYLHGGLWYYVDYPQAPPVRASHPHYRTGGIPGIVFKFVGVISLIVGICLMFGDGPEFIVPAAFLLTIGVFGTVMAIYDSTRNHALEWKVGATIAAAAYVVHSLTDEDR
jgi:hypothetical protein